MSSTTLSVLLLAGYALSCVAVQTIPPAGSVPSVSVPFNASLRSGSDDLPPDHPRIRPGNDPLEPEQVHLMYYGSGEVLVSWVTGRATLYPGEPAVAELLPAAAAAAGAEAANATGLLNGGSRRLLASGEYAIDGDWEAAGSSQAYTAALAAYRRWQQQQQQLGTEGLHADGQFPSLEDGGLQPEGQREWQGDQGGGRPADPKPGGSTATRVEYGTSPDDLSMLAVGWQDRYSYAFDFPGAWNYTSGLLHHVPVMGLKPLQEYFYRVGRPGAWSGVFSFVAPPAKGQSETPLRIGLMADVGQTYNSSDTMEHMLKDAPHVIFHVGDLSYADDYQSDGELDPWVHNSSSTTPPPPGRQRPAWGSFQPRWDHWGRLAEPLASHIPYLVNTGNHEIERQSNGVEFGSYEARFPTPHLASGSKSHLFYSSDVGPVHAIFVTSYTAFERGSHQYKWLHHDLRSVDRTVTPWVVLTLHAPLYNSYLSHFKENECMRIEIEPLLYAYGVDIVFSGHTHAYERSNPVYRHRVDECGPAYITIGDGGNIERLAIPFVDGPGNCPDPDAQAPWDQPQKCVTYQDGEYCPQSQPKWSAFREPSFGHGILTVHNATYMEWAWNRNQDPVPVVTDSIAFVQPPLMLQRCGPAREAVLKALLQQRPGQQQVPDVSEL